MKMKKESSTHCIGKSGLKSHLKHLDPGNHSKNISMSYLIPVLAAISVLVIAICSTSPIKSRDPQIASSTSNEYDVRGGSGSYPPPVMGDWIVSMVTYVENDTILLNGNLTIQAGASLTLKNVTLILNATFDGQYGINVQESGNIFIYDYDNDTTTTADSTNITAADLNFHIFFIAENGSTFIMKNSELHGIGYSATLKERGLYIESDNALIEHSILSYNRYGVMLKDSNNSRIENSTISLNNGGGIEITHSNNVKILNNVIFNNSYGIDAAYVPNILVKRNVIKNHSGDGIEVLDSSNITIRENYISNSTYAGMDIERSSNTAIFKNIIESTGERGIYLVGSSPIIAENELSDNTEGIVFYYWSNATLINNTINNSTNYDIRHNEPPIAVGSFPVLLNTSFNKTKVYFYKLGGGNTISNLTIQWYMHVKVVDLSDEVVADANVEAKDINDVVIGSGTTDSDGCLRWIVSTEYIQNDTNGDGDGEDPGEKIFFTPHNVTASKDGYVGYADPEPNMSESKEVVVRLPIAYTTYTITKDPLQGNVTVDGLQYPAPAMFSWLNGDTHTISVDSPESGGTNVQYVYDFWDDFGAQTHVVNVGTVDTEIIAYYFTQYRPTVTLIGTDSAHTVTAYYTQNGLPISFPGSFNLWSDWCDEGTSLSFDIDATGSTTLERWHTYDDFTISPWNSVSSPFSTTVTYYHQFNVTIATTGLISSYPATINAAQAGSPINPTTYTTWNDWADADSSLGINESISVTITERYHTVDPFSWIVDLPIDTTVNYYHQYSVIITATGLDAAYPATIAVVQHGSSNNPTTSATWSDWADASSILSIENTVNISSRERYHTVDIVSWTVNSALSSVVNYIHQYVPVITFIGTDSTHAVDVIHALDGLAHDDTNVFNSWNEWADEGSTLTFDECTTGTPTRCTIDIRTYNVNSAFDATITYTESPSTVTYTITKSPAQGYVVVDGVQYIAPATFNWAPGTLHNVSVGSPEFQNANMRYVFEYWDDGGAQTHLISVGNVDKTITAFYGTQYKVNMILIGSDETHHVSAYLLKDDLWDNDTGVFASWSDWVDENSTLNFDECTSGSPRRCTTDTRTWTIKSALDATIRYSDQEEDGVRELNYKPLVALIFSIVLFLIGAYITNKKPLRLKDDEKRNKMFNFLFVVMPFVVIEAITGIVSLLTGLLSIPPLIGLGTVVDLTILIVGLLVFVLIYRKRN